VLHVVRQEFNNKSLNEIFILSTQLSDIVFELDPNMERSIKFKRELDHFLAPYKKLKRKGNKHLLKANLFLQTPDTSK
jgi:hypothetical protein